MPYKVARSVTLEDLEKQVNELMKAGWTPLGGIREETYANTPERFLQACVKPEAPAAGATPAPLQVQIVNQEAAPVFVKSAAAPDQPVVEPQSLPLSEEIVVKKKKTTKAKKKTTRA